MFCKDVKTYENLPSLHSGGGCDIQMLPEQSVRYDTEPVEAVMMMNMLHRSKHELNAFIQNRKAITAAANISRLWWCDVMCNIYLLFLLLV